MDRKSFIQKRKQKIKKLYIILYILFRGASRNFFEPFIGNIIFILFIFNLIPFAESGQIVPTLNMIFDHKWFLRAVNKDMETKRSNNSSNNNEVPYFKVLHQHHEKKTNEIKQICNENYNAFIDSIDQILQIENKVRTLREGMNDLNQDLQQKGVALSNEMEEIIELKATQHKIDLATKEIRKLIVALELFQNIQHLIANRKYVNALKSLNILHTNHLLPLKHYKLTQDMTFLIPELVAKIKINVSSHFKNWIYESTKESVALGTIAMEQSRLYFASIESN
ncbi:hypothetical protein RFI_15303, partial [Reticulomyxa filosa]